MDTTRTRPLGRFLEAIDNDHLIPYLRAFYTKEIDNGDHTHQLQATEITLHLAHLLAGDAQDIYDDAAEHLVDVPDAEQFLLEGKQRCGDLLELVGRDRPLVKR